MVLFPKKFYSVLEADGDKSKKTEKISIDDEPGYDDIDLDDEVENTETHGDSESDNTEEPTDYTDDDTSEEESESSDDEPTDYTDDESDSMDDEETDYSDDSESTDDMSTDENNEESSSEEDVNDNKKNNVLIEDYIKLYHFTKSILEKLSNFDRGNVMCNSIISQVTKNITLTQVKIYDYIIHGFSDKYITNLYQYNLFIQGIKINIEMLKKIKDFDIKS